MQGKKGRHGAHCLGTGISYSLTRCNQDSSLLSWHLLSCLVLVWLTLCREGFSVSVCLPIGTVISPGRQAVAVQTDLILP